MDKKQEALLHSFLTALGEEYKPLYSDILACLTDLEYYPVKVRSNLSFKHSLHKKQIAKIGFLKNQNVPFLALRYSACKNYSEKIAAITEEYLEKYPKRTALCTSGGCSFCKGGPDTHVYRSTGAGDAGKAHCGAYAVELRGITADDADEIKGLIREEHAYLMKHEAS